jgi:hypothetical protein
MGRGRRSEQVFEPDDVALLESVLELVPDLALVAFAAKHARQKLEFPVNDRKSLSGLLTKGRLRFRDRVVTKGEIDQFFPEAFFPISSEDDFMCKLLIACQLGRIGHVEEARASVASEFSADAVQLPSPQPRGLASS